MWNFGYALRQGLLLLYRIDPTGKLGAVDAIKLDHLGMVHDFVVTQRHLVFVLAPFIFDSARFGPETPFLDAHVWRPELGTRVLTVDKDDFKRQRWYQLPPGFHFHFGNAWEDAGGTIRFDYCVGPDPTVMTETLRYVMRGEWRPPTGPSRFGRVTLHASSGRVEQEISDLSSEFPRVAPAVVACRYRYVYLLAGDGGYAAGPLNVVVRWDLDSGANERFAYGTDMLAEEHVFVPRPGSDREDDGWLVGTVLDLREKITRISVFDARRLSDGPVASVTLPYALPLGFHGTFVPA